MSLVALQGMDYLIISVFGAMTGKQATGLHWLMKSHTLSFV
jgi:hypothetical protein